MFQSFLRVSAAEHMSRPLRSLAGELIVLSTSWIDDIRSALYCELTCAAEDSDTELLEGPQSASNQDQVADSWLTW